MALLWLSRISKIGIEKDIYKNFMLITWLKFPIDGDCLAVGDFVGLGYVSNDGRFYHSY
jgi:hypothetical protein